MSEIKNDELNQATETNNIEAETPIVEEINESKTKTTISDFFKKCFSKEKLKKTIAVILLAAIVIGGVCGVISYNSPKSVARRYVVALCQSDLKTVSKLTAIDWYADALDNLDCEDEDVYFDKLSKLYDEDITSWGDYFKVFKKSTDEVRYDWYGEYKYSYEVTKIKDISAKKLKDNYYELLGEYEEKSLIDADSIEKGKKVTVKVKLDTEEDGLIRETYTVILVKMSGGWKALDYDFEKN